MNKLPQEVSIGAVPFIVEKKCVKYLIIFTSKSKYWEFPKGHREQGETDQETLRRELLEETGISEYALIKGFKHRFIINLSSERKCLVINYPVRIFGKSIKLSNERLCSKSCFARLWCLENASILT